MIKVLDYNVIREEAQRFKISPYLIVKRKVNYRLSHIEGANCGTCTFPGIAKYSDGDKFLCEVIGVSKDPHAGIDKGCVCDWFKKIEEVSYETI